MKTMFRVRKASVFLETLNIIHPQNAALQILGWV